MGQALLRLAAEDPSLQVVAAVVRKAPAQRVIDGVPHFAASELSGAPPFDAAIDFSLPEGFDPVLALCLARNAAFVSGTTGIDAAQQAALAAAAQRIPLTWATNFSLGVAVLAELVERAAASLPGWDCDIVESHHVHKKDAPSGGTALTLGEAARHGGAEPRYASLRAGDIIGEHVVQFAGWASGWSWSTAPPTATSPAAPCMWPGSCGGGRRVAIPCASWWRPARAERGPCAGRAGRGRAHTRRWRRWHPCHYNSRSPNHVSRTGLHRRPRFFATGFCLSAGVASEPPR